MTISGGSDKSIDGRGPSAATSRLLRHSDAESSLKIDNQLELCPLQGGQVGRLGAIEDAADVTAGLQVLVNRAGAITHQAERRPALATD